MFVVGYSTRYYIAPGKGSNGSSTSIALHDAAVADQIITFLVIIFIILQSKAAIIFYLLCVVVAIMTYEHHVMVFNHNNP